MSKIIFVSMLMWTPFAFTQDTPSSFCDRQIDLFVDKSSMQFFEFTDQTGTLLIEVRMLFQLFQEHINQARLSLLGSYENASWWSAPTVSLLRFGDVSDFPRNEAAVLKRNRRNGKVDLLINPATIKKMTDPVPEIVGILATYLEGRKCLPVYEVEAFSPPF